MGQGIRQNSGGRPTYQDEGADPEVPSPTFLDTSTLWTGRHDAQSWEAALEWPLDMLCELLPIVLES